VTIYQLSQFLDSAKRATLWFPLLSEWLPRYDMQGRRRMLDFMAQVAHESMMFSRMVEIASGRAYEGRADLGNTEPGDGMRFKGRAPLQITGRSGYKAVSLYLFSDERLLEHPELLEDPQTGLRASLWWWKTNGLHLISDKPDTWTPTVTHKDGSKTVYTRFDYLTLRINGGQNGREERIALRQRAERIFI
jgi:predicted chitinase